MKQPLQWIYAVSRKEEDGIFRKCSATDIMRLTQHKNILSAQSTRVIQTVNGFGRQGSKSLCGIAFSGYFRTNGLYEMQFKVSF